MKNMSFLFLLDDIPPCKSANGICAEKIMQRMILDYKARVSCLCFQKENKDNVELEKDYQVYQIKRKMAERITCYCRKHSSPFKRILLFAFRSLFFLYRKLLIFWWPVDSLSAAVRFYMKSKRLIEEQGITHIIAISFPGETMLAAKWLKRKYKEKIKIILYPLDITICGRASSKGIERYLTGFGGRRFFKSVCKDADSILVLENVYKLFCSSIDKSYHQKFLSCGIPMIQNHADGILSKSNHDILHIVYAGSLLYELRNPIFLLDLFENQTDGYSLFFDFYGTIDEKLKVVMNKRYQKITIIQHDWIDESELNDVLWKADFLLNIGNTETHLIPSKLFKYMSMGKPIIHLAFCEEDPCLPYLEKYGKSVVINPHKHNHNHIISDILKISTMTVDPEALFPTCTANYTARRIMQVI